MNESSFRKGTQDELFHVQDELFHVQGELFHAQDELFQANLPVTQPLQVYSLQDSP